MKYLAVAIKYLALIAAILCSSPSWATTIYTAPTLGNSASVSGWSWRQEITTSGNSLGQIQITYSSSGAGTWDHQSYCISTGASSNCTAAPVEVTFPASCGTNCTGGAGGHGFSCSTNCVATSNFISFATSGTDVIVITDENSVATESEAYATGASGVNRWYQGATASWNQQSPAGFTSLSGTVLGVTTIVTQSGGGARLCLMTLLGAGC